MLHERSEKERKGNIVGAARDVPACPQAERVQLQSTNSLENTQGNALLSQEKGKKNVSAFREISNPWSKAQKGWNYSKNKFPVFLVLTK